MASRIDYSLIKQALSVSRMSTYENRFPNTDKALELYAWNANVSACFLAPLHICEVVIRNAVSDALTAIYGHRWPWVSGFERSLPDPNIGYSPRKDLLTVRRREQTTGKVIPELKFVFWQKMFTSRHDQRIWNQHLLTVLQNLPKNKTASELRLQIHQDLEHIRTLRNRIAHHEPVFSRDLKKDFQKIEDLISFRCDVTRTWMVDNQQVWEYVESPIT